MTDRIILSFVFIFPWWAFPKGSISRSNGSGPASDIGQEFCSFPFIPAFVLHYSSMFPPLCFPHLHLPILFCCQRSPAFFPLSNSHIIPATRVRLINSQGCIANRFTVFFITYVILVVITNSGNLKNVELIHLQVGTYWVEISVTMTSLSSYGFSLFPFQYY